LISRYKRRSAVCLDSELHRVILDLTKRCFLAKDHVVRVAKRAAVYEIDKRLSVGLNIDLIYCSGADIYRSGNNRQPLAGREPIRAIDGIVQSVKYNLNNPAKKHVTFRFQLVP
jgi:hypothetical protein